MPWTDHSDAKDLPLNLEALTDFNIVASHGGFSRASRASGRPKATLSRHVSELEECLGMRLLERVGKALRLTEEGRTLHVRTVGLLNEVLEVAQELSSDQDLPQGKLRVSTPTTFGYAAMGRLAGEFALRYPAVKLEVTIDDRKVDLIKESYDVVIRVNPDPASDLVGRCFYRDHMVIVAPPSYVCPVGKNSSSFRSDAVPAIVCTKSSDLDTWTIINGSSSHTILRKAVLRLSSPLLIREAVLANAGAAMIARKLVAADLAAGRMVCWGSVPNRTIEIWALHTSRRLVSSKLSAFIQFICAAFADGAIELKGHACV